MKKIKEFLDEIYDEINFDEKQLIHIIKQILKQLQKKFVYGKVMVGGSFAKGTMIKGKEYDIDLFFIFDKQGNISEKLKKTLKKIKYLIINSKKFKFNFQVVHGSRDYFIFSFQYKDIAIKLEMIPVLKIKKASQASNIIDASPLHVKYIRKKLSEKQKREVKLLKAFTKAIGCYGAESYVRGFSGYSLELLIIYYKNFLNLVKNALRWKPIVYIDIERYYKNKKHALEKINPSKISPILLIDPIDKNRNALAALSEEKFNLFIEACKKFLARPSKKFFIKEELNLDKVKKLAKKRKASLIYIKVNSKAKFDVAGSKILKLYQAIKEKFKENYQLVDCYFKFNENKNFGELFFIVKKKEKLVIEGPPLKLKNHVTKFKKKHRKFIIKNNKIFALKKPKNFREILKVILKDKKIYKIDKVKVNYFKYSS